jgi:hypothetical protein
MPRQRLRNRDRERGVEDGDPCLAGRVEVDLVRPDAVGAHREQVRSRSDHRLGDVGLGADAQQRHPV